jgi:hypothetical protein
LLSLLCCILALGMNELSEKNFANHEAPIRLLQEPRSNRLNARVVHSQNVVLDHRIILG